MLHKTGCDGVVVGRGCLGRPWLFAELAAALTNQAPPTPPTLGEVATILRRHGHLLSNHMGELRGVRELRKHVAWYLKGFPVGSDLRRHLGLVESLAQLDDLLDELDPTLGYPPDADGPRGRQGSPGRVVLPAGWLDDPENTAVPHGAELATSGG
jgi:tRNA-dihydrouridine synthase